MTFDITNPFPAQSLAVRVGAAGVPAIYYDPEDKMFVAPLDPFDATAGWGTGPTEVEAVQDREAAQEKLAAKQTRTRPKVELEAWLCHGAMEIEPVTVLGFHAGHGALRTRTTDGTALRFVVVEKETEYGIIGVVPTWRYRWDD